MTFDHNAFLRHLNEDVKRFMADYSEAKNNTYMTDPDVRNYHLIAASIRTTSTAAIMHQLMRCLKEQGVPYVNPLQSGNEKEDK